MTDSRQAKAAQQQFSQQSEYYAGSQQHRAGEGLGIVRDFVSKSPGGILVDVGTGTGFTALGVSDLMTHVIATDISSGMLNEAERIFSEQARDNISIVYAEAESLPFESDTVDVVTSRQAAHHFHDLALAVREAARILKPGGIMVVTDPLAPESLGVDQWMNDVEVRRDYTHVKDRTMNEWLDLLGNAQLVPDNYAVTKVYLEFDDWVRRSATPQSEVETLRRDFIGAASDIVSAFNIDYQNNQITFHWDVVTIRSVKPY